MTCEVVQGHLIETARGRELASDLRGIVFGHAAACPECAEKLEVQQQLSAVFSEIALRSAGAPKRMEDVLLRQLPSPIGKKRVPAWEWIGAGIAAALVAGFIWVGHASLPSADHEAAVSGFVALPYAEETFAGEQTDVISVSLPGESLLAMGIPVSPDLLEEQIQADVEIGMDGTARAIRLAN